MLRVLQSWLFWMTAACSIPAPSFRGEHEQYANPSPVGPAQWTQYGFDQRNSQTNPLEAQLDRSSVPRLRERWRLHVPDGATSTPVVVDGSAYFGDWGGRVYAVDAE